MMSCISAVEISPQALGPWWFIVLAFIGASVVAAIGFRFLCRALQCVSTLYTSLCTIGDIATAINNVAPVMGSIASAIDRHGEHAMSTANATVGLHSVMRSGLGLATLSLAPDITETVGTLWSKAKDFLRSQLAARLGMAVVHPKPSTAIPWGAMTQMVIGQLCMHNCDDAAVGAAATAVSAVGAAATAVSAVEPQKQLPVTPCTTSSSSLSSAAPTTTTSCPVPKVDPVALVPGTEAHHLATCQSCAVMHKANASNHITAGVGAGTGGLSVTSGTAPTAAPPAAGTHPAAAVASSPAAV